MESDHNLITQNKKTTPESKNIVCMLKIQRAFIGVRWFLHCFSLFIPLMIPPYKPGINNFVVC